jgi:BlaI family transcriptional regulator, penicillinase repressor
MAIARRDSRTPQLPGSDELRLLQILWSIERGSAHDIVAAHRGRSRPNYNTTLALLRRMEGKKFVRHTVENRAFIFEPLVTREAVDRGFVQSVIESNFAGSASDLFHFLLETAAMTAADIGRLESFLRDHVRPKVHTELKEG